MNDINITINIFAVIDDIIKSIDIDPKPGLAGRLSESEILRKNRTRWLSITMLLLLILF